MHFNSDTITSGCACICPPENNSDDSKKKKSEDEGKSAASNGDTGQSTTPTSPAERGKGKLEKRRKGRDKSEKAEGKVIYDRVRDRAQEVIVHVHVCKYTYVMSEYSLIPRPTQLFSTTYYFYAGSCQ